MRYVTLDVFTDRLFQGNPLAVVLDGDGLSELDMQAVAAEFGYSETVFVCTPDREGFDAAVRIFTPSRELEFAGHPLIGTALALSEGDRELRLEVAAGPVEVSVRSGRAELAAPQPYQQLGTVDPAVVARACGLPESAILGVPVVGTTGTPFVLAETSSLAAARPVSAVSEHGAVGVLLYCDRDPVRARMFAPAAGVPEDPATGSAATVLAGHLGEGRWVIRQGLEMGRPSVLLARADTLGRTWVAGSAVEVMRGELLIANT